METSNKRSVVFSRKNIFLQGFLLSFSGLTIFVYVSDFEYIKNFPFNREAFRPPVPCAKYMCVSIHADKNVTLENIAREYILKSKFFTTKPSEIIYLSGYKSPCWKQGDIVRCLPRFRIAGFPKCGTSDLWNQLIKHPLIPGEWADKEPQWWAKCRFPQWNVTFSEHTARFERKPRREKLVIGDASPQTLYERLYMSAEKRSFFNSSFTDATEIAFQKHELAPIHLVTQYTPMSKTIISMRNPVDRAFSHYGHMYSHSTPAQQKRRGPAANDFHKLVVRQLEIFEDCLKRLRDARSCARDQRVRNEAERSWVHLYIGLYVYHIQDAMQLLRPENVKIIHFDRYSSKRIDVLHEVFNFIGLDESREAVMKLEASGNKVYGASSARREMLPETKKLLTTFYSPYNSKLAEYLGDSSFLFLDS